MVSIRYLSEVGEFCSVKSRPLGRVKRKTGAEDGADRQTVAAHKYNAATRIAVRTRWRCAGVMIANAWRRVPLALRADFQIASVAIVRNRNTHAMMRKIRHYGTRICLAAYHCVRRGGVQAVNLYLDLAPPGPIAA